MLNSKIKSAGWFLVKAGASALLLYYATRKIDLSSFSRDVRALHPFWLLLGMMQLLAVPILGGQRWRVVLSSLGSPLDMGACIRIFWIGMMCSQMLPSSSGGDAVRVVLAWHRGVAFARSAHSVILERLAMIVTLVAVVAIIQILGHGPEMLSAAEWVAPVALAAAIVGIVSLALVNKIFDKFPSWRVFTAIADLSSATRLIFLMPNCLKLAGLSVLTHLNLAIAALWLGSALDIHLSVIEYVYYISLITLITALPLTIGGWGIREGAVVALFAHAGVPGHSALAFSILYGLSVAAVSFCALPLLSFKRAHQLIDEGASLNASSVVG